MGDQHHKDNLVYVTCGHETSIFEVDSEFEAGMGASATNADVTQLHLKDRCAMKKDRCYRNNKPTDFETGMGASPTSADARYLRSKSTKSADNDKPCLYPDEPCQADCFETHSTTKRSSSKMGRNRCDPCPPVKACRSRELRGGILYTDCHCLRRNGLQYDCRRSGCQRSPECEIRPAPTCEPSRQACLRHRTNPHAEPLTVICDQQPQR